MPSYFVNEAAFTLPDRGFVDRTIHRIESPLAGEDPLSVEIRRVPIPSGRSLRQVVDAEVAASKVQTNGFTVVEEAEIALDGAPAIVLRARLRAHDAVFYQLQAHVALGDSWVSLTVQGPSSDRALCEETFDRIVRSLEWRTA